MNDIHLKGMSLKFDIIAKHLKYASQIKVGTSFVDTYSSKKTITIDGKKK